MEKGHTNWLILHHIFIGEATVCVILLVMKLQRGIRVRIYIDFERYDFTINFHFFCPNRPESENATKTMYESVRVGYQILVFYNAIIIKRLPSI